MKASLKIEAIGNNTYQYCKLWKNIVNVGSPELANIFFGDIRVPYWCARIIDFDKTYKYQREFLKPKIDYTKSNSIGSRGIYYYYILDNKYIYEVSAPLSWKKIDRYFCMVNCNGEIKRIEKDLVDQWIKEHLASTF